MNRTRWNLQHHAVNTVNSVPPILGREPRDAKVVVHMKVIHRGVNVSAMPALPNTALSIVGGAQISRVTS